MNLINTTFLENNYSKIKESKISGRYLTLSHIKPLYNDLKVGIESKIIGSSEQYKAIYQLKLGSGKRKILVWSQMHGNESTGTKAVFDFLNFIKLYENTTIVSSILKNCDITIIPMLNPDGAEAYTRLNANKIDLNRDAVALKAKESQLLRKVLDTVNPDFSFNLHDQRTIFGVEGTKNPATISFLAPSQEITRKITKGRTQTMNVIVAMNNLLQKLIPNHIGRYTDEFYPTATGDNFQKLGHNTILIEAGHFPNDYERETVRKYNFYALLQGIYHISKEKEFVDYLDYFTIPNNSKIFYDVIYRSKNNKKDVAFQYEEKIEKGIFAPSLIKKRVGDLSLFIGHKEFNKL